MNSIWLETAHLPRFEPLAGNLNTNVLVIGGGIAGLLCAYQLTQAGVDCVLVEANRICGGTTQGTTAKITAQHGLVYHKLIQKFGVKQARLYLEANLAALEQYRTVCRTIDCDFVDEDAFAYSIGNRSKLEQELSALARLGFGAELVTDLPLPFSVAGAVRFPRQARFHPLKFAAGIAKDLRIFENTKVLELAPGKAVTNRGTIRAKKTIIATHFPFLNKHGGYFLKLYQHRSYMLALKNAPTLNGMYVDEDSKGLSFCSAGEFLLLGGGAHRTGKPGEGWQKLKCFAQRYFPEAQEAARWAAQDCMTLDGVPYVGQYGRSTPDLYVATGFNKWGMTSAMAAATLLANLVRGKESPYAPLLFPNRTVLRVQLAINGWESVVGLLTPTTPRCPHMGCALKYNPAEHSWDCPCHGSRFGEDGTLIDNPATDDKQQI